MCFILISANINDNGINRKVMLIYLITFLLLNPSELCKCSVYCMESRNYYVFIEIFLLVGQKWGVPLVAFLAGPDLSHVTASASYSKKPRILKHSHLAIWI